jgi:hypothetical protein
MMKWINGNLRFKTVLAAMLREGLRTVQYMYVIIEQRITPYYTVLRSNTP